MNRIRQTLLVILFLFPPLLLASNIKSIYGYVESVTLLPSNTLIQAKLDTGAGVSSLSALNITYTTGTDKQKKVSFDLIDKKNKTHFSNLAITGEIKIKKRSDDSDLSATTTSSYTSRPIVDIPACFDGQRITLHANLANRSHFLYPLLIGRKDLIPLKAIVDPSQKLLAKTECTPPPAKTTKQDALSE